MEEAKYRVSFPFARGMLIPREQVKLEKLPDFELRVRDVNTGEIRSEFFKGTSKITDQDMRGLDMTEVEAMYMRWLKDRYGEGYLPADYSSWTKMAAFAMIPYFFGARLKHLRPEQWKESSLVISPMMSGDAGAGPKMRLLLDKNLQLKSTFYHVEYMSKFDPPVNDRMMEAGYDSEIQHEGALAGRVSIFGSRQIFSLRHRFIKLRPNFDQNELKRYVYARLEAMMPGVISGGLIRDFQWLEAGKYFGGDEPLPLLAANARAIATEVKEDKEAV